MRKTILLYILTLCSISLFSQVGIGTTNPDNSALLELNSSNRGFLLPRVSLLSATDITTIPNPVEGLMIYNLQSNCNLGPGMYVFDGTKWRRINYADSRSYTRLIRDEIGFSNVTISTINSNNSYGPFSSLFDNVDNTGASSFHVSKSGSPTGDWGFGMTLPASYYISGLILDGRNDCCTNRIVNVLVRLYRCGNLVYSSAALSTSSTGDNTIDIPDIYADEIRLVVPNGGNTAGGGTINFSELDVLGSD